MKPHRTSLLANAATGSVRLPAQGTVVSAPAYAAHTRSNASPPPDHGDPTVTSPRQATALRERLSQTRARIARAHAERPPQIKLDWDADEPLTRVYQGERLPPRRAPREQIPAQQALQSHPEQSFAHPAEPTSDSWYSDLRAHPTHEDYTNEPSNPQPAHPTPRNHAQAAFAAQHAHATPNDLARNHAQATLAGQHAHATPNDLAHNHAQAAFAAQHAHATPNDFPSNEPRAAQHAHATPNDVARRQQAAFAAQHAHATPHHFPAPDPRAAQHAHATPNDFAADTAGQQAHAAATDVGTHAALTGRPSRSTRSDQAFANSSARTPRANDAQARSFTHTQHTRANRTRARAEQALTARVQAPIATESSAAPRESLPPPSAADALQHQLSTQRERLTLAVTSTVNTVRDQLGQLYAGIDRSDAALRKRVAYCSLGLLVVAAVSRIAFGGATSEAGASESSQAAATHPPATVQKASVSISTDPPGALISLDGQAGHQASPAKLTDLAPGRHTISLKLAGYAETKEAINLPADALVSIKLASLSEPRFTPEPTPQRAAPISRAEQRAQARELARERRAAARAAKVLLRYRARMGLPPDPVAQELVDAYGPTASAE